MQHRTYEETKHQLAMHIKLARDRLHQVVALPYLGFKVSLQLSKVATAGRDRMACLSVQ